MGRGQTQDPPAAIRVVGEGWPCGNHAGHDRRVDTLGVTEVTFKSGPPTSGHPDEVGNSGAGLNQNVVDDHRSTSRYCLADTMLEIVDIRQTVDRNQRQVMALLSNILASTMGPAFRVDGHT